MFPLVYGDRDVQLATSQSGAKVQSLWSHTSTPPYASMKEINCGKRYYLFYFILCRCQCWSDSQLCSNVRAFVRGPVAPFLNPYPEAVWRHSVVFTSMKLALRYAAFSSDHVMWHSTLYIWELPSDCPVETGSLGKEFILFLSKRYFCLEHPALERYRRRYFPLIQTHSF